MSVLSEGYTTDGWLIERLEDNGDGTGTFTSASPFPVGDVRFIFGANDKGRITVDTLTFDLAPRPGGWSIGMVRGGRG